MDAEQLAAVQETARRFARREVAPMVGTEGRDGDLTRLPELLARAGEAGLLASADPGSPGFEYGVWGRAAGREGYASSLLVLSEIATECAGFAACLHFAGLGAFELAGLEQLRRPAAVALLGQTWRPGWEHFDAPPEGALRLDAGGLSGEVSFIHAAPGCEAYVVYAAGGVGWERVVIPRDTDGFTVTAVGQRTGLAAVEVVHLAFSGAPVPAGMRLGPARPHDYLGRLMLGLAAIGSGNARGAIRLAAGYAEERFQGGDRIQEHPAVQALLGDARSRLALSVAALSGAEDLLAALAVKLRVTLDCAQAVTDSLQVLGGYGYMEDYRMEKRLRDAMTLTATGIGPDTLRLLCARAPRRGP